MGQTQKCLVCGSSMSPGAPGRHCPACLLRLGLSQFDDAQGDAQTAQVCGDVSFKPGDWLGRYQLIEEIGEGSCGVVFLAEQTEPMRRQVALKIIKLGMDTREFVARFEAERQALAMLEHPGIARIFDAGTSENGRPFFVMELVRGLPIIAHADKQKLSVSQRLNLFVRVCDAMQHAHQKGIIHRDLKPSNILVAEKEGDSGTPVIIDFGIAKSLEQPLSDKTFFTAFHQFIGTPAYMSPEQAGPERWDVDTRGDIYSLGVLLYELLTGGLPFDETELARLAPDEILQFIRVHEPLRPSAKLTALSAEKLSRVAQSRRVQSAELSKLVRGDQDWIVMKCLEKDRVRRYETVAALAEDLERYANNEPIAARPPGNWYRLQKLARRNRLAFAAVAIVLAVLLAGIVATSYQAVRATRAEHEQAILFGRAEAGRRAAQAEAMRSAQEAQFLSEIFKSAGPSVAAGRDTELLRDILGQAAQRIGKDLANQPEVQARLRQTIIQSYHDLGLYPQMAALARESIRVSRAQTNGDNFATAKALEQLGDALTHLRQLNEAEQVSHEALAMKKNLFGATNIEVSLSLNNLGMVLREQERKPEAEAMFREALKTDRAILGNDDPKIAADLGNIGAVLWSEEKFPEAETEFRQALDLRLKLYGAQNPDVAVSFNNLASTLMSERKYDEAEMFSRKAVDIDRKFLEANNADFGVALGNLGGILAAQERFAEAEPYDREALNIERKQPSGQRRDAMLVMRLDDLAKDVAGQERTNEAEALFQEEQSTRQAIAHSNGEASSVTEFQNSNGN